MANGQNPWFSKVETYNSDFQHALSGFFPSGGSDACVTYPWKIGGRVTLGITNSNKTNREGTDLELSLSHRKTYEILETVPIVVPVTPTAGNSLVAGTITLSFGQGDIFVINDSGTLNNTSLPYQIIVSSIEEVNLVGKSVVLKVNLATGVQLKFGNNIILDTSSGSDYTAGTYCITFANLDYAGNGVGMVIEVVSLWKVPGYTNS